MDQSEFTIMVFESQNPEHCTYCNLISEFYFYVRNDITRTWF